MEESAKRWALGDLTATRLALNSTTGVYTGGLYEHLVSVYVFCLARLPRLPRDFVAARWSESFSRSVSEMLEASVLAWWDAIVYTG